MNLISVVIPIFNEEETIKELIERIDSSTRTKNLANYNFEFIFVDDGSKDCSVQLLNECALKGKRVVVLSRNFGHQNAVIAGIDASCGDAVIVMDGDLQDPPELISNLIHEWEKGADVVHTVRKKRHGESFLKKASANVFYKVLNYLSNTDIPMNSGDFKLLDRQVVDELVRMPEQSLYLRGLISWIGFKQEFIEYERDPRYAGHGKYSLRKMLRLALDAVFGFSEKPLYLIAKTGLFGTLMSVILLLYFCWGWYVDRDGMALGWMSIIVVILLLGSFQILALGFIGLFVGRIYRQTTQRPRYVVNQNRSSRHGVQDV